MINQGKILLNFTFVPVSVFVFFACLVRISASTSVIGIIAIVLVSLTVVACASTIPFVSFILSQADAAAVTEEVSFTAVPAKSAKPSLLSPSIFPRVGKISAAMMLKRNITEITENNTQRNIKKHNIDFGKKRHRNKKEMRTNGTYKRTRKRICNLA